MTTKIITRTNFNYFRGKELAEFYKILTRCFKDPNELESLDNLIELVKGKTDIMLAIEDDKVVGGIVYQYFWDIHSMVITYLAVKPGHRNQGIATNLINEVIMKGGDTIKEIYAEIDSKPKKNHILKKLGFKVLQFDYVQPPLEKGKKPVTSLKLVCKHHHSASNEFEIYPMFDFLETYFSEDFNGLSDDDVTEYANINFENILKGKTIMGT